MRWTINRKSKPLVSSFVDLKKLQEVKVIFVLFRNEYLNSNRAKHQQEGIIKSQKQKKAVESVEV